MQTDNFIIKFQHIKSPRTLTLKCREHFPSISIIEFEIIVMLLSFISERICADLLAVEDSQLRGRGFTAGVHIYHRVTTR